MRPRYRNDAEVLTCPSPSLRVGTERVKVRDVTRRIEEDGWRFDRQSGSHRVFRHPRKPGAVTIAGRPGQDVPTGTLGNILRQAGLKGSQR
jgi:predicted RNA binding protein YcfA (HicA-like mRNA interferase family)